MHRYKCLVGEVEGFQIDRIDFHGDLESWVLYLKDDPQEPHPVYQQYVEKWHPEVGGYYVQVDGSEYYYPGELFEKTFRAVPDEVTQDEIKTALNSVPEGGTAAAVLKKVLQEKYP